MTSWPTNWVNCCSRCRVELSWVELCRYKRVFKRTSSKTLDRTCLLIDGTYVGRCEMSVGATRSMMVSFLAQRPFCASHFLDDICLHRSTRSSCQSSSLSFVMELFITPWCFVQLLTNYYKNDVVNFPIQRLTYTYYLHSGLYLNHWSA